MEIELVISKSQILCSTYFVKSNLYRGVKSYLSTDMKTKRSTETSDEIIAIVPVTVQVQEEIHL